MIKYHSSSLWITSQILQLNVCLDYFHNPLSWATCIQLLWTRFNSSYHLVPECIFSRFPFQNFLGSSIVTNPRNNILSIPSGSHSIPNIVFCIFLIQTLNSDVRDVYWFNVNTMLRTQLKRRTNDTCNKNCYVIKGHF